MDTANKKILIFANKMITLIFYFSFITLLILLIVRHNPHLFRLILTCGISFLAVSLFRMFYNAPRPYEKDGITPLITKKTKGHSFPSRHVFSAFLIGVAVLYFNLPCGIILLFCGIILAFLRVASGVHYTKDVVAGAICGIFGGIIGFWLIP